MRGPLRNTLVTLNMSLPQVRRSELAALEHIISVDVPKFREAGTKAGTLLGAATAPDNSAVQ